MKIGILGGTFDPIHKAHLFMGELALSRKKLDKVVFVPAGDPYLKSGKRKITLPVHRYNMTKLATAYNPKFEVSDIEIKREGETYTADTLNEFKKLYKGAELFFIAGADSIMNMHSWVRPEEIFSLCEVIAIDRDEQVEDHELESAIKNLKEKYNAKITFVKRPGTYLSSTEIREMAADGIKNDDLTSEVFEYIKSRGLYKKNLSEAEIKSRLKDELSKHRFDHTLGVAETATDLAYCYNVNPEKAYIAGLLHDCGKPYAGALEHAAKGADIARDYYGIDDKEILDAIRFHTVGNPGMSKLSQIVFLADMIEPGRDKFPQLDSLRKLTYKDLNKATVKCIESTLDYLNKNGRKVDGKTMEVYNYYKNLQD